MDAVKEAESGGKGGFAQAVEAWRALLGHAGLGHAGVDLDPSTREGWGLRTFGRPIQVSAIVRPTTPDQVAAVLAVATAHRVPVHPVSRGANWGLGSRAPTRDGAAVLDLSGLDAITGYDGDRGLVHIQPGVTFQDLAAYLSGRRSRFYLPEIGGPAQASVLANALERGDASLCDRWTSIGDLEVALPDGTLLRTGQGAVGADRLAGASTMPAGAIVDGLFSQSNLGVVTGATLRLEPMPSDLAAMMIDIGGLAALPDFLAVWRDCLMERSLPDRGLTVWNGIKVLARDGLRHEQPAERVVAARTGEWRASILIPAESPEVLHARAGRLQRTFEAVSANCASAIVRADGAWRPGCDQLLGVPSNRNLRTVYWYQKAPPTPEIMDPDRDGCGLIWLCLAFPFDGEALTGYLRWAARHLAEAAIDLNVGIVAGSFRCLLANMTIGYDRSVAGSDEKAIEIYSALLGTALANGFSPYRLANGLPVPEQLATAPVAAYAARLRAVGDPAGILSPGRAGIG